MGHVIAEITAAEAHPLRRAVLRKGMEHSNVHFPQDDLEASFHLGVIDDGEVRAVASFSPTPTPFRGEDDAWQLRGMAVADDYQRRGLGEALLEAAVERIKATGGTVLWCNARDTAQGFYERLGFVVHGDGFTTKDTGLPHHVMIRDL